MTYRKTAVGVVYQGNQFLIVQKPHWKEYWDFPQGGVNNNESLENALLRELGEELGTTDFGKPINTKISLRRSFSFETQIHYPDRGFSGKDMFYFAVSFHGNRDEIKLGDDLSDKKWCIEGELLLCIYRAQINEVKLILDFMKSNKLV